jgi:pilus assembly protein CpaF
MTILDELNKKSPKREPDRVDQTGYAFAALGGILGDDLLRLIHRRLVTGRDGQLAVAAGETPVAMAQRVEALLKALPADPEARVIPGVDPQLEALRTQAPAVIDFLVSDVMGLGPLGPLLADPGVTEIMVNGPRSVFYERGDMLPYSRVFLDDLHLRMVVERLLDGSGRRLDPRVPLVEARRPDGSRVQIVMPPVALGGLSVTIRKVPEVPLDLTGLVRRGMLSPQMATFLEACVRGRISLIVCGATACGKTTLLNAIAQLIPQNERVVVIEDAPQLSVCAPNCVHMQTTPPDPTGRLEITMRDLVRTALRMRPTRLILGECRGPEALDMLLAMTSGHEGCMATAHANSPRDLVLRLQTLSQLAGLPLSDIAVLRQIGRAVDLVVQLERHPDGVRRVTNLTALETSADGAISYTDIFEWRAGVRGSPGAFAATGLVAPFQGRIEAAGVRLPPDFYKA